MLLAVVLPTLWSVGESPSITFYNQALAVFGWGVVLWTGARQGLTALAWRHAPAPLWGVWGVLAACAIAALMAVPLSDEPLGRALMAGGLVGLAGWLMSVGAAAVRQTGAERAALDFAAAMAWAAVLAVLISAVQVFAPQLADGHLVSRPSVVGRAVANLRQPNHLATLLVWGMACGLWLARAGHWSDRAAAALMVMGTGAIVWSASRTGLIGLLLLVLWAWRDDGLPRRLRWLMASAPLWCALWWGLMALWSQQGGGHAFAAAARLNDGSDISSSRFAIWSNVLAMIREQPWTGVGWGQFNLAWTFSAFPDRPVAFFDHTHNLPLHWAVEMGVPLALLMSLLVAWALWVLWFPWRSSDASGVRALAGVMLAMAAFHSLLEYPLWYAYFLLPVAWIAGVGLMAGTPTSDCPPADATPAWPVHRRSGMVVGAAVSLTAVWMAIDFQWVANVYAPRPGAGPLPQRIASAQQRFWFGWEADYAAVMKKNNGGKVPAPDAFRRTLRNLVDDRLMTAYAESLAVAGEVDKARHVAERLREFRSEGARAWFAACDQPEAGWVDMAPKDDAPQGARQPATARPFQCDPPSGHYRWHQVVPALP